MRRIRNAAVYATVVVGILSLPGMGVLAQSMVFPVDRDVGINGFSGEEFTNTGASPTVRGSKSNQHAALFDWFPETKEEILAFIDSVGGSVEVTFNIFPVSGTGGPPGSDVQLETVESVEDWVEGDASPGCCGQFGWTPDTFAVTHRYAQTYLDANGQLDDSESIPWLNDEDESEYVFMNRTGCPPACAIPNAVNGEPFWLDDWFEDDFVTVVLDEVFVEELLLNEFNRGIRLAARGQSSNWQVAMRERGDDSRAFLEVISLGPPPPPPGPRFVRGDANADGSFNISDASFLLNALFSGGDSPTCESSADANDDGGVNIADGVYILNSLFGGDAAPPSPHPECGREETDDDLTCGSFAACP